MELRPPSMCHGIFAPTESISRRHVPYQWLACRILDTEPASCGKKTSTKCKTSSESSGQAMSMSQAVHLIAKNVPGCGVPEGRCLLCSGVSGRTSAVYSRSCYRVHSHVKLKGLKCVSVGASFVCEARKNPDFSRQNKHRFSRNRNKHNEGRESRESFENFEDDMLSSKNGPLISLTSNSKSSASAAPGAREKEIVELFRKVQAQLRERAAIKEEKKVEASQGQDNDTVDSLLKLLRKHSVEQVKRSSGSSRGKDFSLDEFQNSDQYNTKQSTMPSDSNIAPKDESQEVNISVARPRSNFQRRSCISRIKHQPVSYRGDDNDDDMNTIPLSSGAREEYQDQTGLELDAEPDFDSEQELDPKNEMFFPDAGIAELSEDDDSHGSELTYNDENGVEEQAVQDDDLSALKLTELRALAKSRGLKGFSKMKKVELVELLSGN